MNLNDRCSDYSASAVAWTVMTSGWFLGVDLVLGDKSTFATRFVTCSESCEVCRRGNRIMTLSISKKFSSLVALFVLVALLRTAALAETTKVEGVIVGRSGSEIIVEYLQGAELAFLLDDSTKVSQTGGLFKARRTDKSVAALIPGLKVQGEGGYKT